MYLGDPHRLENNRNPGPALHVPVVEWWDQPEDPAVRWERPAGWTLPKAADLDYLLAECPSGPYRTRP